jgi:phospholipase C
VRLRSAEEAEDHGREISEFQAELVELAAALNGDHATEAYDTGELVKGMTVAEAADYCHGAFAKFREECQRCHECGMDGCHVPTVQPAVPTTPSASKLVCSCRPCFNAQGCPRACRCRWMLQSSRVGSNECLPLFVSIHMLYED